MSTSVDIMDEVFRRSPTRRRRTGGEDRSVSYQRSASAREDVAPTSPTIRDPSRRRAALAGVGAQALYRKFRFEPTGIRRRYYAQPVEDAVIMECPRL